MTPKGLARKSRGMEERQKLSVNQASLQRTHLLIVALIAVAAAPFVWRAVQGSGLPPQSAVSQVSKPPDEQPVTLAREDAAEAPQYASLDEDLPPPRATMEATRRAIADAGEVYREGGFLGWVAAVQGCYERLNAEDLEQRVYCLQLDATAYSMERGAPAAFQAADAAHNPYFTPDVFMTRQEAFAPPNDPELSAEAQQRRKGDVIAALTMVWYSASGGAPDQDVQSPPEN